MPAGLGFAEDRVGVGHVLLADHRGARDASTSVCLVRDASRDSFLKLDPRSLPLRGRGQGAGRVRVELLLGAVLSSRVGARCIGAKRLVAGHDPLGVVTVLHFLLPSSFNFLALVNFFQSDGRLITFRSLDEISLIYVLVFFNK